jgi:hypothetical protein
VARGDDCQPVLPRERLHLAHDAGMRLLQAELGICGTVHRCKLRQRPAYPVECMEGGHIVDEQQPQPALSLHINGMQGCSLLWPPRQAVT